MSDYDELAGQLKAWQMDAGQLNAGQPNTSQPNTSQPNTSQPNTSQPNADQSSAGQSNAVQPNAVQPIDGASLYDAAAQQLKGAAERQRAQVALAVSAVSGLDPDYAAENRRLARRFNTLPEVVDQYPDEFRQCLRIEETRDALANAPILQQHIADNPTGVAPVMYDAVHNTAAIERGLAPDAWQGVLNTEYKQSAALSEGYNWLVNKLTGGGHDLNKPRPSWLENSPPADEHYLAAIDDLQTQYVNAAYDKAAQHAPQRWPGKITSGLAYAPYGGLAPFVVAGTEGMAVRHDLIRQGVDENTASVVGAVEGVVLGAFQKIPMGNLQWGEGLKTWLKSLLGASIKSGMVGAGQSVLGDWEGSKILEASGYDDLADKMAPTPEKALEAALTQGLTHLGTQGVKAVHGAAIKKIKSAADAEQTYQNLVNLTNLAAKNTYRGRDPEGFNDYLTKAAAGKPAENLYVDGNVFTQAMDKAGITPAQLKATLPDVAAQVNEAQQTIGVVKIPTADFLTHFAGSDLGNSLLQHVTIDPSPGVMTKAGSDAHAQNFSNDILEEAKTLAEEKQNDAAWNASHQAVHDSILRQLDEAAIHGSDVNTEYARLRSNLFAVGAHRTGTTPEEFYQKWGAKIVNGDIAQAKSAAYDNSDTLGHGGDDGQGTDNAGIAGRESGQGPGELLRTIEGLPPNEGFSELTKIRSRDKSRPLVVYRGSDSTLTPEHFGEAALGYASGSAPSGRGVHFSTKASHAEAHGKVQKYHVDMRNPYVYKTDDPNAPSFDTKEEFTAWRNSLKEKGYDGIVEIGRHIGGWNNVIAFDPHQVIPVPEAKNELDFTNSFKQAAGRGAPEGEEVPESSAVDPDEAWAEHHQKKAKKYNLSPEQAGELAQKAERDPVTGLYTDDELQSALDRAKEAGGYRYTESDTFNGGGINAHLGANAKADEIIRQIGQAYEKAFQGAPVFHRSGWRFAAITPEGFDAEKAAAKAQAAVSKIAKDNGLENIVAPKARNSKGMGLYSAHNAIEAGASHEQIIGKTQADIKAAMPQEVDDVNRRKAYEAWLVSSEGQARRVAERVGEGDSGGGRAARDSSPEEDAALSRLDPSESVQVKNAGRFLDPEAYRKQEDKEKADRLGLKPAAKKAFVRITRRDALTGFFTKRDLNPTIQRAIDLNKKDGTPSSLVVFDVKNLGGATEVLGRKVADRVLRNIVNIAHKGVGSEKIDVIPFRHGGDEVAFVVVGAEHDAVLEAMQNSESNVQRYAKALGVDDLPHAKYLDTPEKYGVGVYAGTEKIDDEQTVAQIREAADKRVELAKKSPKPKAEGEPMKLKGEGVFNSKGDAVRGYFDPVKRIIGLTQNADLSTLPHEFGHEILDIYSKIAKEPDAPPEIRADVDKLLDWFGVKGEGDKSALDTWHSMSLEEQRPHHEKMAEAFEKYFWEGKAPSLELQPVFSRIKAWMRDAIRRAMKELPDLNPEVRAVFDRMFASEDAIKEAEASRGYKPLYKEKPEGVSDRDWQEYHQAGEAATRNAVDKMEAKSIGDMKWLSGARNKHLKALQKKADGKRAAIRAESEKEIAQQPAYRMQDWLKENKTEAASADPEIMAELFGYHNGEAALKALQEAPPRQEAIKQLTDRRMLERHGELATPEGIEEAATEAIHNDARARHLAIGLKLLARSPVSARQLVKDAKEATDAAVAAKKVRDLNPRQYEAAEARANREAHKLAAQDTVGAIKAQRASLLNNQLVKSTRQAMDEVSKGQEYLKRFEKEATRNKLPAGHASQIETLLEQYGLRHPPATGANPPPKQTLADWAAGQRETGTEPQIPSWLTEHAQQAHYQDLTVEQYRSLVDAIKNIERSGKEAMQAQVGGDKGEARPDAEKQPASGMSAEVETQQQVAEPDKSDPQAIAEKPEPKIEEPNGEQESGTVESRQRQPSKTGGIDKKPFPMLAPGGGLDAHEALGGHLLKRHVGKTEKELRDRFIREPDITGSSSFFNQAVAEEAVAAILKSKQAAIETWLTTGLVMGPNIEVAMKAPVGITISKGSKVARPANVVKLILRRDKMAPLGYYIFTGFPK